VLKGKILEEWQQFLNTAPANKKQFEKSSL
jgi:hypothetical protein